MREVVASSMTEEIFQLYSLLYQQQAEGVAPLGLASVGCARVEADPLLHRAATP